MFTIQLHTGTVRYVVQEVLPLIQRLYEVLPCLADELVGTLPRGLVPVVAILQQIRSLRKSLNETSDIRLLFFRSR